MFCLACAGFAVLAAGGNAQEVGSEAAGEVFDLVLAGGRVMDPESGTDVEPGYVGIRLRDDGSSVIEAVSTRPLRGRDVQDCTGKVVAPGFIDPHVHAMTYVSMRAQAYDGVTTALELESGVLPIGMGYDLLGEQGRPINYGFSSAWTMARMKTMDGVDIDGDVQTFADNFGGPRWQGEATAEESRLTLELVEKGIEEGSIGIGMNLGYAPESNPEEFVEIARLAARHKVPVFVHMRVSNFRARSPGEPTNMTALEELIRLAEEHGAHMHVCHLSSTLNRAIPQAIEVIEAARRRGVRVTSESYPYGAGSTVIGTPATSPDALWGRGMTAQDVYWLREGRRMRDAEDLAAVRAEHPGDIAILHFLDEEREEDLAALDASILYQHAAIGSDAMPLQIGADPIRDDTWPLPDDAFAHPRSLGTHTKLLASHVRERRLLTLMEVLRKSSLLVAQILEESTPAMKNKGRIRLGADADIIVFDDETVKDKASYEKSVISAGMEHVIVNGRFLIRNGEMQPEQMSGLPIRRVVGNR